MHEVRRDSAGEVDTAQPAVHKLWLATAQAAYFEFMPLHTTCAYYPIRQLQHLHRESTRNYDPTGRQAIAHPVYSFSTAQVQTSSCR